MADPPVGFKRRIIQPDLKILIESTCNSCGKIIVGSISEGLIEDEEAHRAKCRLEVDCKKVS